MKKSKRAYKVSLEDSSRLQEIWSKTFSSRAFWFSGIAVGLAFTGLALLLLLATPLKKLLPDGGDASRTRQQLSALCSSVDSLRFSYERNKEFYDNMMTALDTDRPRPDSTLAGAQLKSLPVDSLLTASPAERRFVARMAASDKYNLSVLSPVAAEGLIFSPPTSGGIMLDESQKQLMVKMIAPKGTGVCSIADGYVIDCYPTRNSYTIIIQHPNGFLSRYTNVGMPLVRQGSRVYSGQRITEPARPRSGSSANSFGVELWHDGTPLFPADYIFGKHIHNTPDSENDTPA